jgi:hypothetical protein
LRKKEIKKLRERGWERGGRETHLHPEREQEKEREVL